MVKDFWRKLIVKNQLMKARLLDADEFTHSEIVDSLCYELGGCISTNGEAPSIEKEAAILGYDPEEHKRLVNQLIKQGYEKRDVKGRLYSPQIKQELDLRQKRRKAGLSGGNPALIKQKNEQEEKQPLTLTSNSSSNSEQGGSQGGVPFVPDWLPPIMEIYPGTTRTPSDLMVIENAKSLIGKETLWGFCIEPEHLKLAVERYAIEVRINPHFLYETGRTTRLHY